jgi:hypothetical protein
MKAIKRLPVELNPDNVIQSIIYSAKGGTQACEDAKDDCKEHSLIFALKMPHMQVLCFMTDSRDCHEPTPKSRGGGEWGWEDGLSPC